MKKIIGVVGSVVLVGLLGACSLGDQPAKPENSVQMQKPAQIDRVRLDEREMLALNEVQREHVLQDMRNLLAGTQMVVEGLVENDMQLLHDASALINKGGQAGNRTDMKRLGMGRVLPAEFREMGRMTRAGFQEISDLATNGASHADIQRKLVETMHNCSACHATYQIPNP